MKKIDFLRIINNKKVIIIFPLALLIIGTLVFFLFYQSNSSDQQTVDEQDSSEVETFEMLTGQGRFDELINRLIASLENETDPTIKAELTGQLIAAYENNDQADKAFEVLKNYMDGDDIVPGFALMYAEYLDVREENDLAVEYYQKALDELDKEDSFYPASKREIEERIRELNQS